MCAYVQTTVSSLFNLVTFSLNKKSISILFEIQINWQVLENVKK